MKDLFAKLLPARLRPDVTVLPVVRMSGAIMAQNGGMRTTLSLEGIAPALEKAFKIKQAPGVALIINSPGGSAVQSRLIFKRIRDLAEEHEKTVHVFVEDVAASGGYMIACAGDEIIADPSSIVGSIGVIYASFGFDKAIEKLGIERRVHTAGQNKMILDVFAPEKPGDVKKLKAFQTEIHDVFIDLVKSRRGDKLDEEDKSLFTGEFWVGQTALDKGLIDGLGDLRSVLRDRYGEKVMPIVVNQRPMGLFGMLRRMPRAASPFAGAASELISAVEERELWGRYGL